MNSFLRRALPLGLVIAWFLYLIRRAFREQFNVDDITNLCIAFIRGFEYLLKGSVLFWTGAIRPLGELFYLIIYQFAGYWHVPFRWATFAVLVLNLVLLWAVFRKLTPTLTFATVALVLACYNGDMSDMYMSTGTIYDTLCLTFVLLALLCVMRERPRWILAALCTVAAVDSKEMGVSVPAILLAYELIIVFPSRGWNWRRFTAVASTAVVSLAFLVSRLAVRNELSDHPAYKLTVSWGRYLETTRVYLNDVLFRGHLNDFAAVAILLGALLLAVALRNRLMLFGWFYYVLALAPMSFATPRAGYAIYIPFAGAALYVSALIFQLISVLPARSHTAAAALAILVAAANQRSQARFLARGDVDHPGGQSTVRAVADGIGSLAPMLPKGAHLLLINDPFENDAELPHSTLRLRYRDRDLSITRLAWRKGPANIQYPPENYDGVFLFTGENVWQLPKHAEEAESIGGPLSFLTMRSKFAELSIVKDIGGNDGSSQRWVNQDPELLLRVPKLPAHFEMAYSVPAVILQQTKTLDIDAWIADKPAPPIHIANDDAFVYTASLPPHLKTGQVVTVRFHVRNPYIAKGDGAKLAFLLTSAGFLPD